MSNSNRRYLSLNWIKDAIFDKIVSFTRSTTKTRISPTTGLVESVAINKPSVSGRQELWKAGSKNLLAYSDDLTNPVWSITNAVTVTKAGYLPGVGQINRITLGAEGYFYQRPTTLANGASYRLSFWAKKDTASAVSFQSWAGNAWTPTVPLTDSWAQYTVVMTGDGNPGNSSCGFGGATTKDLPFLVAGFQLELGSTATTYEPNPVVFQPGLSIEGQSTNYMDYSNDANHWNCYNCYSTDRMTGPDGIANSAYKHIIGNAFAMIYGGGSSIPPVGPCVISVWINGPIGTKYFLGFNDGNNSTTQTIKVAGWHRIWFTAAFNNEQSGRFYELGFMDAQGATIGVSGFQVEPGSFPSSYIPTSGAAVTRAADVATIDMTNLWNAQEGTLILEVDAGPLDGNYKVFLDSTSGETVSVYRQPSGNTLNPIKGGVNTSLGTTSGRVRVALSMSSSRSVCMNGGSVIKNAMTMPVPTTLHLGKNYGGGEHINGTIQSLQYLPYAVDDLTLKASSELS